MRKHHLFCLLMGLAPAFALAKPARRTLASSPAVAAPVTAAKPPAPAPTPTPEALSPNAPTPSPVTPLPPAASDGPVTPFLETFPSLNEFVFAEPESGFYLGFGLSPIGLLKDRMIFGVDLFQLHWINRRFDLQILNASFSVTRAEASAYQSTNFTFTAAANVRFGQTFSVGPMIGYEFVSFSNLKARLFKSPFVAPEEPFSSRGLIYGFDVGQTLPWRSYLIQLNEVIYQQTYSNEKTAQDWRYIFSDLTVRNQPTLIAPRVVALIKVSFLF